MYDVSDVKINDYTKNWEGWVEVRTTEEPFMSVIAITKEIAIDIIERNKIWLKERKRKRLYGQGEISTS